MRRKNVTFRRKFCHSAKQFSIHVWRKLPKKLFFPPITVVVQI